MEDDIQTQLNEIGAEFESVYQRKHQMDSEDEGMIEDYDDENDELNPLCPLKVDVDQQKVFREMMKEKKKFLEDKRKEIRKEYLINRSLVLQQPYKDPTTIEERTFNDPRTGVPINFIPNDQPHRPRASCYKCVKDGKYKLQAVDERRAEYDLMAYPLLFPEGNKLKFGWTDGVPRVLTKESLIQGHFNQVKDQIPKKELKKIKTYGQKVKYLKKIWGLKKLLVKDFDYKQRVWQSRYRISMKEWYKFMLYERAGRLKPTIFSPEQELHEFNVESNKKLKDKKFKDRRAVVKEDDEVYKQTIKMDGKKWKVKVHPESRISYLEHGDEMKPIPRPIDGKETKFREKEKKSPLLYSGRLKLAWLCDQGLKVENNDLRYFSI